MRELKIKVREQELEIEHLKAKLKIEQYAYTNLKKIVEQYVEADEPA